MDKSEIMLTKQQLERQDFVDNKVFELINSLLPSSKHIDWDIELIGNVREALRKEISQKLKVMNEMQFYPYIKL